MTGAEGRRGTVVRDRRGNGRPGYVVPRRTNIAKNLTFILEGKSYRRVLSEGVM